jgi:cytoskeletal protein RodZ
MKKLVMPLIAAVAVLGVVGGFFVARIVFTTPQAQPDRQVQFVQPAAETVEPTTTPAPVATTAAPKPAPVQSTTSAPAPKKVQQKVATVTEPTSTAPTKTVPAPDDPIRQTAPPPVPGNIVPGQPLNANPSPTTATL